MKILYGKGNTFADITEKAITKCLHASRLIIPAGDPLRDGIFGDPLYGVVKDIIVEVEGKETIFSSKEAIDIDISDPKRDYEVELSVIHRSLKFIGGHIHDEYPEQILSVRYVKQTATVLELGANIGRNTLVLSKLLDDDSRLVTLETDPNTCKILYQNRDMNNMNFHVINAALSYRKLVQKDWKTIPCEGIPQGYFPVDVITFEAIEDEFDLTFDTLVADCEGALYYILRDRPQILMDLHTLILENDYIDGSHKLFVSTLLMEQGFVRVFSMEGGWGPCYSEFYEVWQKLR